MPKSYKTCEIMQQLEYMTEEQIEKGLDHNAVKDYAYILHDKDKDKDGNQKKPHWHICIRFKDSVPTESICKWFGPKGNKGAARRSGYAADSENIIYTAFACAYRARADRHARDEFTRNVPHLP